MVHLNGLLAAHKGDSYRELKKALQQNNIDVDACHEGNIVSNHYMYMTQNRDKIMGIMTVVMPHNLRDPVN